MKLAYILLAATPLFIIHYLISKEDNVADKPRMGGYIWKEQLAKAKETNAKARECLGLFLEHPNGEAGAIYLARLSQAMGDTLSALHEMDSIGEKK